ncbi:sulfatase-like hydrolase/transferase [Bradyrhizobium sp. CB3481]|uniref:sulfatase-like hydrolase/transferase n=1 Tax=Bradyrhizobium sp. CB3481 TaxID=3039158 RepID=UPI0024B0427C|nr:sulfatase-like hydrolase/transferase [Bradyrhizobium sp. CB3481]WFU18366.1 sulfatase-like hydrolase/transferase [Bradyrhizobium sp. CB3481]
MSESVHAKSRGIRFFVPAGLVVAVHLAGLAVLLTTEYGPFAITLALLAWAFVNCFLLVVLRRPGVCAALALGLIVILIELSRFKFGILQLTLTFLDFLIIDRDTFSFLLSVFPRLQTQLMIVGLAAVPLLWALWHFDPFRVRRSLALSGLAGATALISVMAIAVPEQPWEPFQGVNHISSLARSGVVAVSRLASTGWIEADPPSERPLRLASEAHAARSPALASADTCDTTAKRPHIILLLDESSFDVTAAPGIKVPAGYTDFFKSADGKRRTMIAESTGGPTWYTEFNVLTGLSARSFGDLKFYVTRIAAGRVTRGLPQALQRCGYKTVSLYPTYGDFLSARAFQKGTGVERFIDMAEMGVNEDMQPDSFYYDQALKTFAREQASQSPVFMFVYLTANHFPWTDVYRPDLTPQGWTPPGNTAEVDEYIRRQTMTANDYRAFTERLKHDYPDESFLVLRFGDHQPAISQKLLEPGIERAKLAKRLMTADPRYYSTYYAIDGINYSPTNLSSALETLDAAYFPLVLQEAAGLPLDPSFKEQKSILLRCKGAFYSCKKGAEARRFNRMLIDAGTINGL